MNKNACPMGYETLLEKYSAPYARSATSCAPW